MDTDKKSMENYEPQHLSNSYNGFFHSNDDSYTGNFKLVGGGGEYGDMEDRLRTTHGTSLERNVGEDLRQDAADPKTTQPPPQVSIKDLSN